MRILITGATGFIGRALCSALADSQHHPMAFVRNPAGVVQLLDKLDVVHISDISDRESVQKAAAAAGEIHAVVHLAASLNYFGRYNELHRINVVGTENALQAAIDRRAKVFVFASSEEAAGTVAEEEIPYSEDRPARPVSTYGRSKLEAEQIVATQSRSAEIRPVILRIGNVYGPGKDSFVGALRREMQNRGRMCTFLPILAHHLLHFVFIDDVVKGIIQATENESASGTYFLAGPEHVSIKKLINTLGELTEISTDCPDTVPRVVPVFAKMRTAWHRLRHRADMIDYVMAGPNGRIHRAYSIEKAKRDFGYSPEVSLQEGVKRTLQWLDQQT